MHQRLARAGRTVGSCILMAGGLSVDGSRLPTFGEGHKKNRLVAHYMMHGVARVYLHVRLALETGIAAESRWPRRDGSS